MLWSQIVFDKLEKRKTLLNVQDLVLVLGRENKNCPNDLECPPTTSGWFNVIEVSPFQPKAGQG